MNVYIKLDNTTGVNADNFSFYSLESSGGTETFLVSGISRALLVNIGYTLTNVLDGATIIRVKSNTPSCDDTNYEDFSIIEF